MKLYAFTPKGHGQYSFFVMAEDEEHARKAVENKIKKLLAEGEDGTHFSDYNFDGWGTDYYRVEVFDANQVALNAND
jgi:hypothetical protein